MSDDGLLCTITAFLIALFFLVDKVFFHASAEATTSHIDNAVEDFL